MRIHARGLRGFTLIELLVVIAIIAILAALLFPVFARVRESTRQGACMTNIHEIAQDVKLYREDNGKYPPVLLCYPYVIVGGVQTNQSLYTGAGTPTAADNVLNRPFHLANGQKYNQDPGIFQCPDNLTTNHALLTTTVVYPAGVPLSGTVNYPGSGQKAYYYAYDSYDTGPQINKAGQVAAGVTELHYSLDWTGVTGANDPPNQMKYPNPPEDKTVITWCNYHVAVAKSDQVMVLLLNGTAKPAHYSKMAFQDPTHPNGPLYFAP